MYDKSNKKIQIKKAKRIKIIKKATKKRLPTLRSSTKRKLLMKRSKKFIKKQKQKHKKSYSSLQAQNQTGSQNSILNSKRNSKSKNSKRLPQQKSEQKVQNKIAKEGKIKQPTKTQIQIKKQKQNKKFQDKNFDNEKQDKKQESFLYKDMIATPISFPKFFTIQYISSTTPMAQQIRNNFTRIHSRTERTQKSHSEAAMYFQYHVRFQILNNNDSLDKKILSSRFNQVIDAGQVILVSNYRRKLYNSEVSGLRKKAEKKRRMSKNNKNKHIFRSKKKEIEKYYDESIFKVLTFRNVPQLIVSQNREVINQSQIDKSSVDCLNKQDQGVIQLFYFLWRNKQRISVGKLHQISYLKIDPHSDLNIGDYSFNEFISKQPIYIPFDFEKDHTQNLPRVFQKIEDLNAVSDSYQQQQNWKIGMVEFDPQIPKRILYKIVNNEFLRSQFYVHQFTVESKRYALSVLKNDISIRHQINFGQLFKYVKIIKANKATVKKGSQIYLRQIKINLTFSKLQVLIIRDLEVLQPLQFVEFQCLESIEIECGHISNLRSLRKLHLNTPLKKLSLNKQQNLTRRVDLVNHTLIFKDYPYTSGHLRYIEEMNLSRDLIYQNFSDNIVPIQLASRLGLKSVFKVQHSNMLPNFAQYNEQYLNQNNIRNLNNQVMNLINRRIY